MIKLQLSRCDKIPVKAVLDEITPIKEVLDDKISNKMLDQRTSNRRC